MRPQGLATSSSSRPGTDAGQRAAQSSVRSTGMRRGGSVSADQAGSTSARRTPPAAAIFATHGEPEWAFNC